MKKNIIISLFVVAGIILAASFMVGIMELRKGLVNAFDATQTCHSLEHDVSATIELLTNGNTLEGKVYDCGQRRGDTFTEYNDIIYTIRGNYDAGITSVRLTDHIASALRGLGWAANGSDEHAYRLTAAPDRLIDATIVVISPKHQLYNLVISTPQNLYTPQGDDKSALKSVVPPADLHARYASFVFVEPTYQPAGYGPWTRHTPRAWRVGYEPDPRGFTNLVNVYELPGEAAGDDSYKLSQTLNEIDDAAIQARYSGLPVRGQTASSGPIYELQSGHSKNQVRSYMVKRADSFVILTAVGGRDSYKDNFLTESDVVKVFDSLKTKENQ